jgi:exopolyphosphatase / guanosine-5'-triphosphate,3'-diphosphate pyrophosphatase
VPRVAASVDIGSKSVHLLVALFADEHGALEALVDESVLLGLGATVDGTGELGDARRAELTATLVRYVETARRLGASAVTLIATEPLRRARDAAAALAAVAEATGVEPFVLSHEEEGYLTLLGVTAGRRVVAEIGVVDVGGGSSEVVFVGPGEPAHAGGIKVGSARLTAQYVEHDPPTREEVEALRRAARRAVSRAPDGEPRELIAVGGTATNLLRVLPAAALDRILTADRLAEALATLATEPSAVAAERHAVNLVRARILPAGAVILEALLRRYRLDRLSVSDAGIREGAIHAVAEGGRTWRRRLPVLAEGWRP